MSDTSDITRRGAVQRLASLAALGALPTGVRLPDGAPVTPGVQLYTVRSEMAKGVDATLARVAAIGYREVEFAGYFNTPPSRIAALLKKHGLSAPAAHVDRNDLTKDWNRVLDDAAAAGHAWVIVAWVPESDRGSVASWQRLAGEFNRAAEAAKARGLAFAYHNHDFEFKPLGAGGKAHGHSVLLSECDAALVQFELDLYWTTHAGVNAAQYVARYPGRFPLVHVKDRRADGGMTEVGRGTIDFQAIISAARGGIRHFFVEHDQPADPFASITTSMDAMRKLVR